MKVVPANRLTKVQGNGHEHEFEPQFGLPEKLPAGESILWQGSPHAPTLARRVFHLRKLAAYFAILIAWKAVSEWRTGAGAGEILQSLGWTGALSALALGTIAGLAWLTARTTVYTLTSKRVVMRIGIVLTMTFNLPYRQITRADLRLDDPRRPGAGDIVLGLADGIRVPYLQLWPHARPWQLRQPQPMLRSLKDASAVAALLGSAWSTATGVSVTPAAAAPGSAVPDHAAADGLAGAH
jgi:hypothetical protein